MTTIGFLDTFGVPLDRSERELLRHQPDRVTVALAAFEPADGSAVQAVRGLRQVGAIEPGLLLHVAADPAGARLDLLAATLGTADDWTPTVVGGGLDGGLDGGLVLGERAGRDLVAVGDTVDVEHQQALPSAGFRTVTSELQVAGVSPDPMRPLACLDRRTAEVFASPVLRTSSPSHRPPALSAGTSPEDVRRALAGAPGTRSTTRGPSRGQWSSRQWSPRQWSSRRRAAQLCGTITVGTVACTAQ